MTRSTQTKVESLLEKAAEDYGLELVLDYNYGNRGFARFEDPDGFDDVWLRFGFDFQTTYWSLDGIEPQLPALGIRTIKTDRSGKADQHVSVWNPRIHDEGLTATEVIKAIRNHLARIKQNREARETA